ncbi:MAG: hypothetical protein AAF612_00725 [Planctomycetota bacterium]
MRDLRPAFVSLLILFIVVVVTLAPDASPEETAYAGARGDTPEAAETSEYQGALDVVSSYLDAARQGHVDGFVSGHFDLAGMAERSFPGLRKGPSPRLSERFGAYLSYVLADPRAQDALANADVSELAAGPFQDNHLNAEAGAAQVTFTVQPEGVEEPVLNRVLLRQNDQGAWRVVDLGVQKRLMSREVYRGWRESQLPALDYLDVLQREAEAARTGERAAF